jgi:hypothetical protein
MKDDNTGAFKTAVADSKEREKILWHILKPILKPNPSAPSKHSKTMTK